MPELCEFIYLDEPHITLFNLLIERTIVTHPWHGIASCANETSQSNYMTFMPSMLECWNGECVLMMTSKKVIWSQHNAAAMCRLPIYRFINGWSGFAWRHFTKQIEFTFCSSVTIQWPSTPLIKHNRITEQFCLCQGLAKRYRFLIEKLCKKWNLMPMPPDRLVQYEIGQK